jgi:hypothetical protein
MVSQLKSDTARTNGAKSRGPTTAEGKEKSSRNSLKHGLTAGSGNILLDCEDPDQFDEILYKFHTIHEPVTAAEIDIVEEMVAARWRIRRMWTIETGLLNAEIVTQQSSPSVSEGARPQRPFSVGLPHASRRFPLSGSGFPLRGPSPAPL